MSSSKNTYFFEELKSITEKKVKFKINNLGNCKLLSEIILETIDEYINYNTIRRIYGLAPDVKTRTKTLDKLARFNGYKNYSHFIQTYSFKNRLKISDRIYKTIYKTNEKELLHLVKDIRTSSSDVLSLLTLLIRELIYNKQFEDLNKIFKQKELKYDSFSYHEILNLGNSVGIIFRKNNVVNKELLQNTNFLRIVFLIFVDYSKLNKYYGEWAKYVNETTKNKEIKLFTSAIMELKSYMNNSAVVDKFDNLAFSSEFHPVLCSRLLSVKIMANNYDDIEDLLNRYSSKHEIMEKKNLDYFLEIIVQALISKNMDIMKYIINYFHNENQLFNSDYKLFYLNYYYLMCTYYYRMTKVKSLEIKFFKQFSLDEIRYSYEDIAMVFLLIYKYSIEKDLNEKQKIKAEYIKLHKLLNYKKFSISYIDNYFIVDN